MKDVSQSTGLESAEEFVTTWLCGMSAPHLGNLFIRTAFYGTLNYFDYSSLNEKLQHRFNIGSTYCVVHSKLNNEVLTLV